MILFIAIVAILAYLLWPVVKGMIYVHKVQQNVRDAFEQATRGTQGTQGGRSRKDAPRRQKKKIDKDVGEYVEFEEITVSTSSYNETVDGSGNRTVSETETQIVDAEWEDLPPKQK